MVEKRQFLNHTLGSLRQTLKNSIGKEAEDMFRDFFNVKDTVIKSGHILNVGMGYSIFHDKITDLPVYDHGNKQFQGTEYGLEIPKGMTIEKQNKTEKIMQVCKSKEEFVQARCSALNVSLPTIPYEMLSFKAGGGFSYSSTADSKEQSLNLSFRYEVRLFKLKMTDPLAVNKNPDFSTTFEEMVNGLPKTFDEKNPGAYDTFFSDWGQYLITSAHGGGSVELSKDVILTAKSDREKSIGEAQADITLEFSNISMGVSGFDSISGVRKCSSKTMSTNVCWEGGDVEYHRATSTDQLAANDWRKWEASIATNPVMHTTSMSLIPIYQIMAKVPGNEGKKIQVCIRFCNVASFFFKYVLFSPQVSGTLLSRLGTISWVEGRARRKRKRLKKRDRKNWNERTK